MAATPPDQDNDEAHGPPQRLQQALGGAELDEVAGEQQAERDQAHRGNAQGPVAMLAALARLVVARRLLTLARVLPVVEDRRWQDRLIAQLGLADAVRVHERARLGVGGGGLGPGAAVGESLGAQRFDARQDGATVGGHFNPLSEARRASF
jgi:hypothetical protein